MKQTDSRDPQPDETPDVETVKAWIQLANAQFSPRLLAALLRAFNAAPRAIVDASDAQLDAVPEMHSRYVARLRDTTLRPTSRQLAWMERPELQILWLGHPGYPRPLLEISDPPALLFVRGHLEEADRFAVGIVGSRHATPYGRSVAERLARELAGHGLMVISGGAIGIDTAVHRGALQGGGRTIAVLGCGLDIDYPRDNRALFEQVAAQGALISEYPPGSQPETWHFPARNRIISGLSQGVLVVEAPKASGALITARFAVEQGRPVMAVPGNIDRQGSEGTNSLIKDGAVLVTEVRDILQALGVIVLPARPEHQAALDMEWEEGGAGAGEGSGSDSATARSRERLRNSASLSSAQVKLLDALSLTPRHIDAISRETGMSATEAGVEMTMLELTGLVRRLPGNTYIRAL